MVEYEDGTWFGEFESMDGDKITLVKYTGVGYRWTEGRCLKLVVDTQVERFRATIEVYNSRIQGYGVEIRGIVNCLQVIR